jgi:signal transduction histidine kinase
MEAKDNNPKKPLSTFRFALDFIKENPSIILSLALLVVMPLALYANAYFILRTFEKTIETEFLRKAAMVENTIDAMIDQNLLENREALGVKVNEIKSREDEITNLEILVPTDEKHEKYTVAASYSPERVGSEISEDFYKSIAWTQQEGTSHRESQNSRRILVIEKTFHDDAENRIGLISIAFSLQKTDNLISKVFLRSYFVLAVSILIVLLFVFNHARMFNYAVRLTKLKEVDEMKDNFISIASHELRSPLSAMRAYLSFLKEKDFANISEKGKEHVSNLEFSVNRLDNLVDDILEVSRLEQNRIPFEMEILDPDEIISASLNEMKSKALEKNLEISYVPQPLPHVKVDPERLKQIMVNLISNAIKYTLHGKIEISAKVSHRKHLEITVADTGLGISAENQKFLFQKFFRAQNKETADVAGTGLGLWITRELARKMDGDITVESIEGVGSHFTVTFPAIKA